MAKRWKYIRCTLASVGYTTIESAEGITITNIDSDGYVYYTLPDGSQVKATYNSTSPIVVHSDTTDITITLGTTYLAGLSGYTTTAVITNEDSLNVTSECTFSTSDAAVFTTGGTYGQTLTAAGAGSATLSVVHEDWNTGNTASGTTTITVGQVNTAINSSGGTLSDDQVVALDSYALTPSGATVYYLTGLTFYNQASTAIVDNSTAYLRYTVDGGTARTLSTAWTPTGTTQTIVVYDVNAYAYNTAYSGATYTATLVW